MEKYIDTFQNIKLIPKINRFVSILNIPMEFPVKGIMDNLRECSNSSDVNFFKYVASVNHFAAIDFVTNESLLKLDNSYKGLVAVKDREQNVYIGEVEIIKRLHGQALLVGDSNNIYEMRINFSNGCFPGYPKGNDEFFFRFFFFIDEGNEMKLVYDFLDKTGISKDYANKRTNEIASDGASIQVWYNDSEDDFKDYVEEIFEYDRYE